MRYHIVVPSKNFSKSYDESSLRYVVKCLLLRGLTGGDDIYVYKRDRLDGMYSPWCIPSMLQDVL